MDHGLKGWQAYGGPAVCLVRSAPRFTDDIVALRNHPDIDHFSRNDSPDRQAHMAWLAREDQLGRNAHFVILSGGAFAGTVSLDNVVPGKTAELRRFVTVASTLDADALAAQFLSISYALNVLGCGSVWCAVPEERPAIIDFYLRNGWSFFPFYDRPKYSAPGVMMRGLRFGREVWTSAMEERREELARLTGRDPDDWALAAIPDTLSFAAAS